MEDAVSEVSEWECGERRERGEERRVEEQAVGEDLMISFVLSFGWPLVCIFSDSLFRNFLGAHYIVLRRPGRRA